MRTAVFFIFSCGPGVNLTMFTVISLQEIAISPRNFFNVNQCVYVMRVHYRATFDCPFATWPATLTVKNGCIVKCYCLHAYDACTLSNITVSGLLPVRDAPQQSVV